MKQKIITYLKFTIFLALGGFLLWLAMKGQNIDKIKESLKNANYFWIGISLIFGIISHILRALRWKMLITPLGYKIKTTNTFFAVMIGYFANLAFPRLGEVTKCGVLKKYENVPVNRLLGTMIVERGVDLISLVLILILVFVAQFGLLNSFFYEIIVDPLTAKIQSSTLTIAIGIGIVAFLILMFFLFLKQIKATALFKKAAALFGGMMEGLKSVKYLDNKFLFIFYSAMIWVFYFLMAYVCFFALEETSGLGLMAGLALLAFGSIGMVAPVQGGIGAYHILASKTLVIYGIAEEPALAFAFIVHAAQTVLIIAFGFISLILLPIINNQPDETIEVPNNTAEAGTTG